MARAPFALLGLLLAVAPCSPARAAAPPAVALSLEARLAEPGTRALVVVFTASWCRGCEEASARWRELAARYRSRGLRLVAVSTRDPESSCAVKGFVPDDTLCDLDGALAETLGAERRLPAAFAWSWDGRVLARNADATDLTRALETFFEASPRVAVQGAEGVAPELVAAVNEALVVSGKVDVVASGDARDDLERVRRAGASVRFDDAHACELGHELPANAVLRVSEAPVGRAVFASLALYDLATGCQAALVSAKREGPRERLAHELVAKLVARLARVPSSAPRARDVSAGDLGWRPRAAQLRSLPVLATRVLPIEAPAAWAVDAAAIAGPTAVPMVPFAGATVDLGSDDAEGDADEHPRYRSTLEPFELDATEVAVEAYAACVREKKCSLPAVGLACNWGRPGYERHPINCVDWSQASAYCAFVGKRLPSEREWEFAARGPERRRFPWGNEDPAARGCWNGDGRKGWGDPRRSTCEVGANPASHTPTGVADLAGNVWEWTASAYCDYPATSCEEGRRVFRGGSWRDEGGVMLRAALRAGDDEDERNDHLGFRCAR